MILADAAYNTPKMAAFAGRMAMLAQMQTKTTTKTTTITKTTV
ncbi:hypothetical protein [Polycladidibacter hongkongensis]|nr:hypothetical protein [Pseudovibrio hongkongensis]